MNIQLSFHVNSSFGGQTDTTNEGIKKRISMIFHNFVLPKLLVDLKQFEFQDRSNNGMS